MKAIALYSGGLDSILSVLVMLKHKVEITAVHFTMLFMPPASEKKSYSNSFYSIPRKYGFELKYYPLGQSYIDMVKKPAFGYGKNMNPCIDCKIFMLKEAKKLMKMTNSDFVITGEVLGQRPMSQHLGSLQLIEKESGLERYLLRPLCAKLLSPTIPEEKGLIKRDRLYDFSGRNRKNQLALAKTFKLKDIPQPASGCLLTDPIYSRRLKDLFEHKPDCSNTDILLLKLGRHFRLSDSIKLIVGRNERENSEIEKLTTEKDILLFPQEDIPGPTAIIRGENIREQHLELSAGICARYSDCKELNGLTIIQKDAKGITEHKSKLAQQELLVKYVI